MKVRHKTFFNYVRIKRRMTVKSMKEHINANGITISMNTLQKVLQNKKNTSDASFCSWAHGMDIPLKTLQDAREGNIIITREDWNCIGVTD